MKNYLFVALLLAPASLLGQSIGDFTSIQPGPQYQYFILPTTHTYQVLVQAYDYIGNNTYMREVPDYTAFFPIDSTNEAGLLTVSHESIPGGVTIFDIAYNDSLRRWNLTNGSEVDFSGVAGTIKNCSGGITPWETLITAEEQPDTTDANNDGYNDHGWLIEIDPWTREVVDQDGDGTPDKLWEMGCMRHENLCISADSSVCYYGSDAVPGHLYKFVPAVPGQLGVGDTYVLRKPSLLSPEGEWLHMPKDSAWWLNNMEAIAIDSSATDFSGIEDVEFGPDGYIYYSTKYSGRVYRFIDEGDSVRSFEAFVEPTSFPIDYGYGIGLEPWGIGADNLAFDGDGNLWLCQDGSRNYIWVIRPNHTAAKPEIELFGRTPFGSEPTGINFSPDYKFLFMSFQHPYGTNWQTVVDGVGEQVVFNKGTTIVISLDENLGIDDGPPDGPIDIEITEFSIYPNPTIATTVQLNFFATLPQDLHIEVIDINGRLACRETVRSLAGWNELEWESPLAAGVYTISVYNRGFELLQSERIVITGK